MSHYVTKSTHAAFISAFDKEMLAVGAIKGKVIWRTDIEDIEVPEYTLETSCGLYVCHPDVPIKLEGQRTKYSLIVFGKFSDPQRAYTRLGNDVNRLNGKYNFLFGRREIGEVEELATYVVDRLLSI